MSELDKDKEVAESRKNVLKDDAEQGLEVSVPLREQIVKKLFKKLEEDKVVEKLSSIWAQGNNDRSEWLSRQAEYITQVDEFINPIYGSSTDWGSVLHLPTILIVLKTFHARMYAALTGIDPMFTVRARKAANADRERLVTELMRYTLKDWANDNNGVNPTLDAWIWDWISSGVGLLKVRWDKKFSRFVDVEEVPVPKISLQVDDTGALVPVTEVEMVEKEVERTITCFEGPCVDRIKVEDLLIVGGEGDPQAADHVMQQSWMTASELWTLADQGIFDYDAVEDIIEAGATAKATDQTAVLKQTRVEQAGEAGVNKEHETKRYHVIECYSKLDVDGSGIASDIICWFNPETRKLLRATYLYRVMSTGMRPFFKIDFHKRHGTTYGVGLVELLYSLAKEIDAMHNMRVDVGIITSMPWGFYKPTSSTREENLAIEPGSLVPLDNPQSDVYFPNLGNRTSFGYQEEQALQTQIERLTSISDMSLGIIGGQGAARTATGARALLGESNANLDIFLQRMHRGWKGCLKYIFHMLQAKLEPGFQFRLLGEEGKSYWETVEDPAVLKGMYDFELDANSANSNKQIQIEQANQIYQLTGNPLDLQLGIVSPLERYEAIRNLLLVNGVKDVGRYVKKPNQILRVFSPQEIADRLLAGMDVPLDPTQDLEGFIKYVEFIMSEDELLGQFGQNEVAALVGKMQEAQQLMKAVQAQAAQQAAVQQQQMNMQAQQMPGNMQPVNIMNGGEGQ